MMFKILLSLFFALTLQTTFAADNKIPNSNNSQTSASQSVTMQKEANVIAWLITLNNNEINAAKLALNKTQNPNVRDFANFMIKEHTENLDKTLAVAKELNITPKNSSAVMTLKKMGQKEAAHLASLQGNAFDVAYMNAMVKGHTKALKMINEKWLKTVQNPTLKQHLLTTRTHVEHHLTLAKQVQSQLQS